MRRVRQRRKQIVDDEIGAAMVPDSTAESLEDEPAKKAKKLSDDNATNHVAHQRWRRQAVAGSRRKPQRGAGRNAKKPLS